MFKDNFDDKLNSQDEMLEIVRQYENMQNNRQSHFFEHETLEDIVAYYEENSEWEKAYDAALYALEQFPNSSTFLSKKAQFLFEYKQYDEALVLVEKALFLAPNDLDTLILQADILNSKGEFKKTLEILKRCLTFADKEEQSDIYIAASDVYEANGHMDKAYRYAKKALLLSPNSEMAQIRYDYLAIETNRFRESIKIQRKLINAEPYSHLAWYHLGNAWFSMERYKKAIYAYEYAFIINDDFSAAYRDSGEAYFELGNYIKAKEMYIEAQKRGDNDDDIFYCIGLCALHLQSYEESTNYFNKALQINPNNADAYFQLGECSREKGNFDEAIRLYNKALKIDPNCDTYFYAIALVYELTEKSELALLYYLEAIDADKEETAYYIKAASMYFQLDLAEDSIELLEFAMNKFPDRHELLYILAASLITIGRKQKGYVYLTRALQLYSEGIDLFFTALPHLKDNPDILMLIELNRIGK